MVQFEYLKVLHLLLSFTFEVHCGELFSAWRKREMLHTKKVEMYV